jgi:subtilase family serine protease
MALLRSRPALCLSRSHPIPCFEKVDQRGGTSYPAKVDTGWSLEIAMDVEVAHAVCPGCSVLLVEGDDNYINNLAAAADTAAALGATEISNSYGSSEWAGQTDYDASYHHPGVAVTASTGDSGYGTGYPATSPYIVAVGGTSLFLNADNTYKSEKVWSGAGSGCSAYESLKPAGQPTIGGFVPRG